ncbi:MAG: ATP-dependent RNA helicase HrpA [Pseudomonadota bacterium]
MTRSPTSHADDLMLRDAYALATGKRLNPNTLEHSQAQRAAREALALTHEGGDDDLPIAEHRDAIIDALQSNRVIVVSGETGSGKTTQLPRYAIAAGFGRRAMIGHTQPRRIAARAVASRIAEISGVTLGEGVGYAVRFDDRSAPYTLVRVMTDGILLNALQRDPLLLDYEVIIVDEAHERSLNIDFLLGYLKRLLDKRDDLRVIITSATIDHKRFAAHFGAAPVIEVSGRGYPVTVRYTDTTIATDDSRKLARQVAEAVDTVLSERLAEGAPDVLVFLPGEREIRDAERAISKRRGPDIDVVPLYGRLSDKDQARVFQAAGRRRVVLATNVAETSITVPRIGAVIDSGLARISRYAHRSRVQRLGVEPVSQASANQRAGRCGRIGPGLCLRLYPESDFESRDAFTDPEILRTNLASVVLQMAALGLGDPLEFPFLDAPSAATVNDARRLLTELGALGGQRRITKLGRRLARLPLDPRLARMLVADTDPQTLAITTVIVAALSIQDPRLRPPDQVEAADTAHAVFEVPGSDFLGLYSLWTAAHTQREALGRRAYERWCESNFLSPRRIREWGEVFTQLARIVDADRKQLPPPASVVDERADRVHRAVLSGLLSHIGTHEADGEYVGAGARRFRLHPASTVHGRTPRWVMALEIVQTRRRLARHVARFDARWLPRIAERLVEYDYQQPYWNAKRGRVEAKRTSLLFGLVIEAGKRVDFGPIDTAAARTVFLRDALAADRVGLNAEFLAHNRAVLETVAGIAGRLRRRVEIGPAALAARYAECLPDSVIDRRSLARWLDKASADERARLHFTQDQLTGEALDVDVLADMPEKVELAGNRLKIDYQFAPDRVDDGASVVVPAALLPAMTMSQVETSIPGLMARRIEARLRALPKASRRQLHPIREVASRLVTRLSELGTRGSLDARLTALLATEFRVAVAPDAWSALVEPDYLKPALRVVDDRGRVLGSGRDLEALKRELAPLVQAETRELTPKAVASDTTPKREWRFDAIPERQTETRGNLTLTVYPALRERGTGVIVHPFLDAGEAQLAHDAAVLALLGYRFVQQLKALRKTLLADRGIQLRWAAHDDPGGAALIEDVQRAAMQRAFGDRFGGIRDADAWRALCDAHAHEIVGAGEQVLAVLGDVLAADVACRAAVDAAPEHVVDARDDVRAQLSRLVYPGFLSATPAARLDDLPRFLNAARLRLERVASNTARDHDSMAMVHSLESRMQAFDRATPTPEQRDALEAFRWLVEELRVSLFAQSLGTRVKVSAKRLEKRWEEILRMAA